MKMLLEISINFDLFQWTFKSASLTSCFFPNLAGLVSGCILHLVVLMRSPSSYAPPTNWEKKERFIVCKRVSFFFCASLLINSPESRSLFPHFLVFPRKSRVCQWCSPTNTETNQRVLRAVNNQTASWLFSLRDITSTATNNSSPKQHTNLLNVII